jgi:Uma2 family endonuclease
MAGTVRTCIIRPGEIVSTCRQVRVTNMSIIHSDTKAIEYPATDGRPMGESDVHIEWMIYLRDVLKRRYRGRQAYVASNLLVYYEEGNPKRFVVPDNFVVLDCDPRKRRVFKTWEEGKGPDAVFEVTSKGTSAVDRKRKPDIYQRIGVQEIFLFDPTSEYLRPPLQGLRRAGDAFVPIERDDEGAIESKVLSLGLKLIGDRLVLIDRATGEHLLSDAERADAAEREIQALREQLKRRDL